LEHCEFLGRQGGAVGASVVVVSGGGGLPSEMVMVQDSRGWMLLLACSFRRVESFFLEGVQVRPYDTSKLYTPAVVGVPQIPQSYRKYIKPGGKSLLLTVITLELKDP
jgi:hypothetical protein